MENQIKECNVCGKTGVELYECKKCNELYCENCGAAFTQFTQIDYNCCEICADNTIYD